MLVFDKVSVYQFGGFCQKCMFDIFWIGEAAGILALAEEKVPDETCIIMCPTCLGGQDSRSSTGQDSPIPEVCSPFNMLFGYSLLTSGHSDHGSG